MKAYKISDLCNILHELANDGYEYVELDLIAADDEDSESLFIDAIEDSNSSVSDTIDCCTVPEDYSIYNDSPRIVKPTDYCHELSFTYAELGTIHYGITNALGYFKELLKDHSQPKDVIKEIKDCSVDLRNLQAKLAHFLKRFH